MPSIEFSKQPAYRQMQSYRQAYRGSPALFGPLTFFFPSMITVAGQAIGTAEFIGTGCTKLRLDEDGQGLDWSRVAYPLPTQPVGETSFSPNDYIYMYGWLRDATTKGALSGKTIVTRAILTPGELEMSRTCTTGLLYGHFYSKWWPGEIPPGTYTIEYFYNGE